MTVLAVKNYSDRIELATDSGIFIGYNFKEENCEKIFELNEIIFASCGCRATMNLFYIFCSTNKPEGNKELDILRFLKKFIEETKKLLDSFVLSNNFFIIFQNKLFAVWANFDIQEIKENEFCALGIAMQEAKVALYLGHTVKEAIDICLKLNSNTAGKIQEKIIYKNK